MHMKVAVDKGNKKEAVMIFPRHHAEDIELAGFEIRDYNAGYEWRGVVYNKTVHDCALSKLGDRPFEILCVKDAKKRASGTIAENDKVDIWAAEYDHPHEFRAAVEVAVESGSTNLFAKLAHQGINMREGEYFSMHSTFWDLKTDPIDPKVFDVPDACPKPASYEA